MKRRLDQIARDLEAKGARFEDIEEENGFVKLTDKDNLICYVLCWGWGSTFECRSTAWGRKITIENELVKVANLRTTHYTMDLKGSTGKIDLKSMVIENGKVKITAFSGRVFKFTMNLEIIS